MLLLDPTANWYGIRKLIIVIIAKYLQANTKDGNLNGVAVILEDVRPEGEESQ